MPNTANDSAGINRTRIMSILMVGLFMVFMAVLSLIPMLPDVSGELGVSKPLMGIIMGSFMIFMAIPQVPIGVLSDRYGRRPFVTAGILVFSFGLLIFGTAQTGMQLLVARCISGLGVAMFFPTAYTIVNDIYPIRERGKGLGIISMAVGLGTVGGYILGGVVGGLFGWRTVFLSMAGSSLLLALGTFHLLTETSLCTRHNDFGVRKMLVATLLMFKDQNLLMAGFVSMLCGISVIGASYVLPFFATGTVTPVQMGFIFIPYAITSSFGAFLTGFFSDRVGRKPPLVTMILLGGGALLLLSHVTLTPLAIAINFGFVGLCLGPVVTLSTAILADQVMKKDVRTLGTAIGAFNMIRWLGAATGPLVAGLILELAGARTSFFVLGILTLCATFISFFLKETLE
ncbi:MAG: MFS transporter [ANME-2 cluster archaeon]|nr:MFS transporter [ANME-2 cluster archaeon]